MQVVKIGFKRVKGHGTRMTLLTDIPMSHKTWHVKLRPASHRQSLKDEASRLRWAKGVIPVTPSAIYVPTLPVAALITGTIDGKPGHQLIGIVPPKQIIAGLMDALALLRNAPIADFPFKSPDWASSKRINLENLANLKSKRKEGKSLHPDFDQLSNAKLKEIIRAGSDTPSQGVLTHGDMCMPNLLYSDQAKLVGIIDVGALHVNDPLLDLALLSWCIKANMGSEWSDYLLRQYGLDESDSQIRYYRLAYDLSLDMPDAWAWVTAPKLIQQRAKLEQKV